MVRLIFAPPFLSFIHLCSRVLLAPSWVGYTSWWVDRLISASECYPEYSCRPDYHLDDRLNGLHNEYVRLLLSQWYFPAQMNNFSLFLFYLPGSSTEFTVRSARVHQLAAVDWAEFPSVAKRRVHARFPQQTQVTHQPANCCARLLGASSLSYILNGRLIILRDCTLVCLSVHSGTPHLVSCWAPSSVWWPSSSPLADAAPVPIGPSSAVRCTFWPVTI